MTDLDEPHGLTDDNFILPPPPTYRQVAEYHIDGWRLSNEWIDPEYRAGYEAGVRSLAIRLEEMK